MYCPSPKSEVQTSRRRGEPIPPRANFAETYRAFRTNVDLAELALDPKEIFGDLRDETGERVVDHRLIIGTIGRTATLADVLSTLEPLDEDFPTVDDPPTKPEDLL